MASYLWESHDNVREIRFFSTALDLLLCYIMVRYCMMYDTTARYRRAMTSTVLITPQRGGLSAVLSSVRTWWLR